ncbi:hypothetical protein JCM5350_002926 [Sporobolomyces pararoseus]
MSRLQRPQRHNPLRPYMDQEPNCNNNSIDSFSSPTFPSSSGGTNTPLSSDSEIGGRAGRQLSEKKMDHQIYIGSGGGTGIQGLKEPREIVRKRVAIMTICGLVVAAIITIAILGVKKIL